MPGCLNGAEPAPGTTSVNVALSVADAGLSLVPGLPTVVRWVFDNPVIGSASVAGLCAANPSDPGDFHPSMLWPPPTLNDFPSPTAPPGSIMRWLWDKTVYFHFQHSCQCIGTGTPPTPITPITPITNPDGSINTSNNLTQITVLQNNQGVASDGLTLLYNGQQYTHAYAANSWAHNSPAYVTKYSALQEWDAQDEGFMALIPSDVADSGSPPDVYGVYVELTNIPASVARRGTLTPRLYGVGSFYWDSAPNSGHQKCIVQRDSMHYGIQFLLAPQVPQAFNLYWRLMPDVRAHVTQITRNWDDPWRRLEGVRDTALLQFNAITFPPDWYDPPYYTGSPTRSISVPGVSAANPAGLTPAQNPSPAPRVPAAAPADSHDCHCQQQAPPEQ